MLLKRIISEIKRRKSFLKSLHIYTFTNIIETAIPFFLMPILTRLLSTFDYGIIATFNAIKTNANPVISMATPGAVGRAYYDKDKEGFDFHCYVYNALVVNFVLLFAVLLVLSVFKNFIPGIEGIGIFWLFLIPVIVWAAATSNIKVKLWIYQQHPRNNGIFRVLQSVAEFGLSILLVSIFLRSWKGRMIGAGVTEIAFCFIAVYILYRYDKLNPVLNVKYIKDILKFGLPLLPHSFGWMLIWTSDKYFLNSMVGVSTTGVYGVAYALAAGISLLAAPVDTSAEPVIYEKLSNLNEQIAGKMVVASYGYFFLLIIAAIVLWLLSPIILKILVDRKFWGASDFILWIGLGYSAHGMSRLLNKYINYSKETYLMSYNTFIAGVVAVVANYGLIKINGAVGAAQATFIAYVVYFLLTWRTANKLYPMPWFSIFKPKNLKGLFQ
ncbi:MAG TPA: lipopolysaccharide biosynthesis protein [Candidatus Wujingus californicus]|uniref:lipopolysaccharide biosynthesis protein n=1 Tax=Candidatus Wujingus californicus TaxID=3367618 RepID=UPI0040282A72